MVRLFYFSAEKNPIFISKFETCWSICIEIYLTHHNLKCRVVEKGGCFNILVIVVPQICDLPIADTISPSLRANLELFDQLSVGAVCISIYFYITQLKIWGRWGGVCFNFLLLYFQSPHNSRLHCLTVCDFLTVRERCQKKNWTECYFLNLLYTFKYILRFYLLTMFDLSKLK